MKVRAKDQIPKRVLSNGEFVPIKKIAEDLKDRRDSVRFLPGKDVWPVLTMAMNYAAHLRALNHIQSWYDGKAMSENHPDLLYHPRAFPEC